MTDIAQTLRNLADGAELQQAPHNYILHLRAGADEIERLRSGIGETLLEREDARAEVERLRAALEQIANVKPAWGAESEEMYNIARAALEEGRT